MPAGTVTLRQTTISGATNKGAALTHDELDSDFILLPAGNGGVAELLHTALRRSVFYSQYSNASNFNSAVTALDDGSSPPNNTLNVIALGVGGAFNSNPVPGSGYHILDVQNVHSGAEGIQLTAYGTALTSWHGRYARGTITAPTAIKNLDDFYGLGGRGYTGTQFSNSAASIHFGATEDWSDTNNGCSMRFTVTPNGSTPAATVTVLTIASPASTLVGTLIMSSANTQLGIGRTPTAIGSSSSLEMDATTTDYMRFYVGGVEKQRITATASNIDLLYTGSATISLFGGGTTVTVNSSGLNAAIGQSTPAAGAFSSLNISTGGSTTISTGVGSVKMSSVNAATNTAWIPIAYAGTTYFVPGWTTNSP